ncbi:acyltransferase [Ponticaulis sp.]|uniref:acyltransferase family protein n=1 Tax=Ponticaulis sp. TaxID=2020902 RepID=UPI000C3B7444|nr:acyltransferase [Ponticaulis sp.]MAF58373.1 acyltransferase [Ponticaulis sp.]MBN04934.1 acyltransferase [Ponticaulis sp.]
MDISRQRFDSLTGLRFILAIWIAYFHVGHMYDHDGFGALPYLELGVARVDVFFVLSGFVLTHIYWNNRNRPFAFGDFMVARIARIYPLHILALGIMLGFLVLGMVMGRADMAEGYPLEGLFANLFMMQSFGAPGGAAWNFPAWAISAEFAGYLAFPLYIWLATKMKAHRTFFFGLCLLNVYLVDQVHQMLLHRELSSSTMAWGALRGAVVMLAGVGARVAFEDFKVSGFRAGLYALAGAGGALLAAMNHVGTAFVAAGGALMIMSLARIDAEGKGTFLAHPTMCALGGWSYAIFILHVPTFMIMKNALDIVGIPFVVNAWTSLGFTLVVVAIAYPIHKLIEEPCRKAIRGGWEKRARRSKEAQTA